MTPPSPEVLAMYAGETRALMIGLAFGLVVIGGWAVFASWMWLYTKRKLRRTQESAFAMKRLVDVRGSELSRNAIRIKELELIETDTLMVKANDERIKTIRKRTDERLVLQNAEVAQLHLDLRTANDELGYLRAICVDHVSLPIGLDEAPYAPPPRAPKKP